MFDGGGGEQTWLGENAAKKAYVLVIGIFDKVHCMAKCKEFEG